MTIAYDQLKDAPRLLMECELKPLQGDRFQPTGFADLGPARYTRPDGTEMLLVESAQSVANRLEWSCWDEANDALITRLQGLPYIVVKEDNKKLTNSILEAHRINSPYILEGTDKTVFNQLKQDTAALDKGPVRLRDLAKIVFKCDPNAVLHGVFIAKSELAGGRLRLTRVLSGFIEAEGASPAESGGVKNDRVDPSGKAYGLSAEKGTGNVPFHRTEFVAKTITAYFNLDLALLRGYGLTDDATKLLIALALFKIRRFLSNGLRLRTACDFEPANGGLKAKRPDTFVIPSETLLLAQCEDLIATCTKASLFAAPSITEVKWQPPKKPEKANDEAKETDAD